MKSFCKAVCGAAAILLALGLLLCCMGFALGGRPADLDDYYDNAIDLPLVGSGRIGLLRWGERGNPLYGKDTVEQSYAGVSSQIRRLDFDLGYANVTIREGDTFQVKAKKINAKRFTTEVDGDTWRIECDVKHADSIGAKNLPTITVTVPKGYQAEEIEIENSVGTMEIRGLSAKESSLKAGMGTMTVKDFSSGDCDLDVGMGTLELSGTITGQGTIDCGMGSVELTLTGDPQDYGFSVTVGMGAVTVNGEEINAGNQDAPGSWGIADIGGLAGERSWNTSAPNFFQVDCGMGSVDILFRK